MVSLLDSKNSTIDQGTFFIEKDLMKVNEISSFSVIASNYDTSYEYSIYTFEIVPTWRVNKLSTLILSIPINDISYTSR